MSATVHHGDVFDLLPTLPPGSVDVAVTSPPYWRLRQYLPVGHPDKARELGGEDTPAAYVETMVRVCRLVREAMADHAVFFLNCGDSYSSKPARKNEPNLPDEMATRTTGTLNKVYQNRAVAEGIPAGNLCLIPQRLAIALQDDGWLVRSVIVWCLSPSTRVYARTATTEGPATLHDLVRLDPATVKLWNGSRWTQVRGWGASRCEAPVRLTLRSGETISATPNHEWPLKDGRVVRTDALAVGDVLATCALPESPALAGWGIEPDLAWFAGLYLAEGCIDVDAVRISGHTKETSRHDRVAGIAEKYGGTSTLRADEGESVTQTVHGDILRGVLAHFVSGKGAHGKHLHPRCWGLPNRLLDAFLNGYLAGDGHRDPKNDRWRIGFCRNDAWAADLRTLAARLGATLTLNPTYAKMGRTKTFEAYRGELRFERTGHWSERDRAEVVAVGNGWAGDYIDVGVEDEPHLFALASGVLTHNSKPAPMPSSVSGWAWKRCRVKVSPGAARGTGKRKVGSQHHGGDRRDVGSFLDGDGKPEWSDCPGCKKCRASGGYVLRRGSWRPTSAWEPVLMLAKGPNYFCDSVAVQEPAAAATLGRNAYSRVIDDPDEQFAVKHDHNSVEWYCENCSRTVQLEDAKTTRLPAVPQGVHAEMAQHDSDTSAKVLQSEVLLEVKTENSTQKMPDVREGVRPGQQADSLLQPNLWDSLVVEDKPELQGEVNQSARVHSDSPSRAGAQTPVHDGTSLSDGTETRKAAKKKRGGASRQRAAGRQPAGKPDGDDCETALSSQGEEVEKEHQLPALQQANSSVKCCPHCDGPLICTKGTTANPRDVWTIAAEPAHFQHYAAFPSELVHRCLKAATSARGYCPACGAPWVRVVGAKASTNGRAGSSYDGQAERLASGGRSREGGFYDAETCTLGWRQSCPCPPAEPRPGRVLDPFCGSGRVGLEAARMGLDFTGVELNEEYVTLSRRLLADQLGMFA